MSKIKLSKNVKAGKMVFLRGDKICVASKVRPLGVFSDEQKNIIMTLDGETVRTTLPPRVVMHGPATVQMFVPDLEIEDGK